MALITAEEKRKKGIYYTPNDATRILCSWAIRDANDRLLEPSFGACGFLEASRARLEELGCEDSCYQLYGCDLDDHAFELHLWPLFDDRNDLLERFLISDFLAVWPENFDTEFDAIIGNPPYVAHHRMSDEQKVNLQVAFGNSPWNPGRRADLWAYFVLHSLRFLRQGGRVAWILPGSSLHSDYAAVVRNVVGTQFGRSLAIQLGQKLFVSEGAQENTVVLLADGYGQPGEGLRLQYAATLADLTTTIERWDAGEAVGEPCGTRVQEAFLSADTRDTITWIEEHFQVKPLSDFCTIRIGIVTGANPFFLFNSARAKEHELPAESLRPLLPKFEMVSGLELTPFDLQRAVESGFSCLLVDTRNLNENEDGPVQRYLATFDEEAKQKNHTFRKRNTWHQPDDGLVPCAFLSYMHEHGPRLALNTARTTSTNTVHRVFFHDGLDLMTQQAIAVALQSTFGQLCAEIEGRAYGSGVLKHEPSGARRIRLLLPRHLDQQVTREAFLAVDRLFREGKQSQVQDVADRFAMGDLLAREGQVAFEQTTATLKEALKAMRAKRHHSATSFAA